MQVKEMPFEDKLRSVREYTAAEESVFFPLVRRRLGENAVQELGKIRSTGTTKLSDDASAEDRFEEEFADWIFRWGASYGFIRERLGDSGVEEFQRDDVEALKRMNAGIALSVLGFVRAFSKGRAFKMLSSKLAYELQVFTPFTISEATRDRLVLDMASCKILDYPGCENFCQVGCGVIFPRWMKEQLHVVYETRRQGKSCRLTISPV